jgi:hypothetical protein
LQGFNATFVVKLEKLLQFFLDLLLWRVKQLLSLWLRVPLQKEPSRVVEHVGPNMPKRLQQQGLNAQERKARQSLTARKKATGSKEATPNTAASFDDAFKDARRAKVKTFTWRGKKYTTEMK